MITGSRLLAQYLETSGKGFKARANTDEARAAAARLNLAAAEKSLLPNAARDTAYSVSGEEISRLMRRTDLVDGRTSANGLLNVGGYSAQDLGVDDLSIFGGIDANLTAGNTPEEKRRAQRQRSNLLAGRPLDAEEEVVTTALDPSKFQATAHANTILQLRTPTAPITVSGKESRITKGAKGIKFADDEFKRKQNIRDSLYPIISESGRIINASDRSAEEKQIAQKNLIDAQELLAGIGEGSQANSAIAISKGEMSGGGMEQYLREDGTTGTRDRENMPVEGNLEGLPTAEQGSAYYAQKAGEQVRGNRSQAQIDEYSRVYGGGKDFGTMQSQNPSGINYNMEPRQENFGMAGQRGGKRGGFHQMPDGSMMSDRTTMTDRLQAEKKRLGSRQSDFSPEGGAGQPESPSALPTAEEQQQQRNMTMGNIGKSKASAAFQGAMANMPQTSQASMAPFQGLLDSVTPDLADNLAKMGEDAADKIFNKGESMYKTIADSLLKSKDDAIAASMAAYESARDAQIMQKNAEEDSLRWEESKTIQRAERDRRNKVVSLMAKNSIMGGIGSGGGIEAVEMADAALGAAIDEMRLTGKKDRKELAAKLAVKLTELSNANKESERVALKEYNAALANIAQLSFQNEAKRDERLQSVAETYANSMNTAYKEYAARLKEEAKDLRAQKNEERDDERVVKNDAWDRLEWVAATYYGKDAPRSIVEAIQKELPDVDVDQFLASTTAEERKEMRLRGDGDGGGVFGSYMPTPQQKQMVSYDDFVKSKIDEMQDAEGQTFSVEKREKLKEENEELWSRNYKSATAPSFDQMPSSGNANVDILAKGLLDGTVPESSLRLAAKEAKVSLSAVLNQTEALRRAGYTPDDPILTPDQQKSYVTIMKAVRQTENYKLASSAHRVVTGIEGQIALHTGTADVAAINLLQRGIIDFGVAVREDDIRNIKNAVPVLSKLDPKEWKGKVLEGIILTDVARQHFLDTAHHLAQDNISTFNDIDLPRIKREAKRFGLPESMFQDISDLDSIVGTESLDDILADEGLSPTEE